MDVEFGTVAVFEEMAKILNEDEVWLDLAKDITTTMIYHYRPPVDRQFFLEFENGRVTTVKELDGTGSQSAAYEISGAPETWRRVLEGHVNPTVALTTGGLRVKGKLSYLLRNMNAFSRMLDAMTHLNLK